jgi:short-subunit dehydrogenase
MFSRLDLRGSRILLTGASSGIGRALAEQLADQGARLVVASRNRERLEELTAAIRARGGAADAIPADVADPAQRRSLIDQAVAQLGGLDVLINNAGVGSVGPFLESDEARLRRIFEVNFFGTTELTRLALPHLLRSGRAMVVTVASVIGRRAVPGSTEYCASKFALCGWAEALRAELAQHRVHVLLVCPGLIATEFGDNLLSRSYRYGWELGRGLSAERCARQIVQAMRRRRSEVTITASGRLLLVLNRLMPRLVDQVMLWYAGSAQRREEAERGPN